ncbi:MAG: 50S ribosomal protein L1 [Patescibacteria group bacterium]|nr:50S ribosomal protein L1 [Patescibacteria group bacterium]
MSKHSRRYQNLKNKLSQEEKRIFEIEEAVKKVKEGANAKFDESIEAHIKLNLDKKSGTQVVRGTIVFPKSWGKSRRIAAFVTPEKMKEAKEAGAAIAGGEELVQKIKTTQKVNFDLALAEPAMMRHLGQIGKLLGQKGLMPNPKSETVTPNIIAAIKEFASGKISFKSDEQGIVHQVIGKMSFSEAELANNFKVLLETVKKQAPEGQKGELVNSISVCSTMGPGVRVRN